MFFAALLCSNHWTFCSFQWLKLTIWVLGISSIFKFENWLGTLGFVTFWKLGVFDKNPKIMKSAYFKSDFFGHFQLQILTTGKPLEIDSWNQVQIIPWYLSFCREKVPGEYIYPVKRKPYGLFWQSEIWNSPHKIILVSRYLWWGPAKTTYTQGYKKSIFVTSIIFPCSAVVPIWKYWMH